MRYNQYLNEKGIEDRHIFCSYERVFNADDYFDWLVARDKMLTVHGVIGNYQIWKVQQKVNLDIL